MPKKLHAPEVNEKGSEESTDELTTGTGRKAKQRDALFRVILREAVRIMRKHFVSLSPARRQSIKLVVKVNWNSERPRVCSSLAYVCCTARQ